MFRPKLQIDAKKSLGLKCPFACVFDRQSTNAAPIARKAFSHRMLWTCSVELPTVSVTSHTFIQLSFMWWPPQRAQSFLHLQCLLGLFHLSRNKQSSAMEQSPHDLHKTPIWSVRPSTSFNTNVSSLNRTPLCSVVETTAALLSSNGCWTSTCHHLWLRFCVTWFELWYSPAVTSLTEMWRRLILIDFTYQTTLVFCSLPGSIYSTEWEEGFTRSHIPRIVVNNDYCVKI